MTPQELYPIIKHVPREARPENAARVTESDWIASMLEWLCRREQGEFINISYADDEVQWEISIGIEDADAAPTLVEALAKACVAAEQETTA